MNFLDLFACIPLKFPGEPSRGRSGAENLTAAVGTMVFPIVDFVVVLFAELWMHPVFALFVLPALFTGASFVLGRLLRASTRWTLIVCLGCSVTCFMAGAVAFLMGIFSSFYSGF